MYRVVRKSDEKVLKHRFRWKSEAQRHARWMSMLTNNQYIVESESPEAPGNIVTTSFLILAWVVVLTALTVQAFSTTYEEVSQKYGSISGDGTWTDQDKWLVDYQMSQHPNIDLGVTSFKINKAVTAPLHAAFSCIETNNLSHHLTTFSGSHNIRKVRNKDDQWSAHAYGLAIDFNAKDYPHGSNKRLPQGVVDCFTQQGWTYGGDFTTVKDPMHFSISWE